MGSGMRPDALRVEVPIPVREGAPPGALAAPATSAQHVKIRGADGAGSEKILFSELSGPQLLAILDHIDHHFGGPEAYFWVTLPTCSFWEGRGCSL